MRRMRGRGSNGHGVPSGSNSSMGGSAGPGPGGNNGGGAHRRAGVPNRHQVFDSNGPDVRIRGNAWQVFEKYQTLARDSQSAGDRVKTESYLQHAEHYYRIILSINEALGETASHHRSGGRVPQGPEPFEDRAFAAESAQPMASLPPAPLDPGRMPQPSTDDLLQPQAASPRVEGTMSVA